MSTTQEKRDYYEVLGVTRDAEPEEIHKAYKKLGVYDFPQNKLGRRILVRLGWFITGLPGIRTRFPQMIKKQMIQPYAKVLNSA